MIGKVYREGDVFMDWTTKFAYLPVKIGNGNWLWWEYYKVKIVMEQFFWGLTKVKIRRFSSKAQEARAARL